MTFHGSLFNAIDKAVDKSLCNRFIIENCQTDENLIRDRVSDWKFLIIRVFNSDCTSKVLNFS